MQETPRGEDFSACASAKAFVASSKIDDVRDRLEAYSFSTDEPQSRQKATGISFPVFGDAVSHAQGSTEEAVNPFTSGVSPSSAGTSPFASPSTEQSSPFSGGSPSPFSTGQTPPCGGGESSPFGVRSPFGESSLFGGESSPFGGVSSPFGGGQSAAGGDGQVSPFSTGQSSPFGGEQSSPFDAAETSSFGVSQAFPFDSQRSPFESEAAPAPKQQKMRSTWKKKKKKQGKVPKYLLRQQQEADLAGELSEEDPQSSVAKQQKDEREKHSDEEDVQEEVGMGQLQELLVFLRSTQRENGPSCSPPLSQRTTAFVEREHSLEDMLATIREVVELVTEEKLVLTRSVGSGLLAYCIVHGNDGEYGELLSALLEIVPLDAISTSGHGTMGMHSGIPPLSADLGHLLFPGEGYEENGNPALSYCSLGLKCSPLNEALCSEDRLWAYRRIVKRVGANNPQMAALHTATARSFEKFRHGPLLFVAAFYGTVAPVLELTPGLLYHTLLDNSYLLFLTAPDDLVLMWDTVIATYERVLDTDPKEFPLFGAVPPASREEVDETIAKLSQSVLLTILDFTVTLACNQLSQGPRHRVSYAAKAAFARGDPYACLQEILLRFPDWLSPGLRRYNVGRRIVCSTARSGRAEVARLLLALKAFSDACLLEKEARLLVLNAAFEGGSLELGKEVLREGHPLELVCVNSDGGCALYAAMKTDGQWTAEVVTGKSEEFALSENDLEDVRRAKKLFWRALYGFSWSEEQERCLMPGASPFGSLEKTEETRERLLNGMRLAFDVLATLGLTEFDEEFLRGLLGYKPSLHVAHVLTEKIPAEFFATKLPATEQRVSKTIFARFVTSNTEFMFALAEDVPEMLEGLTRKTWDSFDPLTLGYEECLLRLLPHMPTEELLKRDTCGRTALHIAVARMTSPELIEELRMALPPSAVNITDDTGRTPLALLSMHSGRWDVSDETRNRLKKVLALSTTAKRAL